MGNNTKATRPAETTWVSALTRATQKGQHRGPAPCQSSDRHGLEAETVTYQPCPPLDNSILKQPNSCDTSHPGILIQFPSRLSFWKKRCKSTRWYNCSACLAVRFCTQEKLTCVTAALTRDKKFIVASLHCWHCAGTPLCVGFCRYDGYTYKEVTLIDPFLS